MTDWSTWTQGKLVDREGRTIGRIEAVVPDVKTQLPTWGIVKTGYGYRPTYLPYADIVEGMVRPFYSEEAIRAAPAVEPGAPLTESVAMRIVEHYASSKPGGPPTLPPPPQPMSGRDDED